MGCQHDTTTVGHDCKTRTTSLGPTRTTSPLWHSCLSAHTLVYRLLGNLTISRMELDKGMAERPIGDAFDISLPVNCRAGYQRSWELGQWVEVHVVDDGVHGVGNDSPEHSGQQDRHGPILVSLHRFVGRGKDAPLIVVDGRSEVYRSVQAFLSGLPRPSVFQGCPLNLPSP